MRHNPQSEVLMKIIIKKNEAKIENDGSIASQFIAGCKGKVKIKTPFGEREIGKVEKS